MKKWQATGYADCAAGLAAIELLWGSFIVAGCASAAYWGALPLVIKNPTNPTPIPTYTTDLGELHNAFVSNYLVQGFSDSPVDIPKAINVAIQVRPDLAPQFLTITQAQYDQVMAVVDQYDFSSSQGLLSYITSVIQFTPQDLNTLTFALGKLDNLNSPILWVESVNSLITQVLNFTLDETNMNNLIGSLQILRSSGAYWSGYRYVLLA